MRPCFFLFLRGLAPHGARVLGKEQAVNRLIGDLELDISHAQALLGWQPPFSVEQEFLQSFLERALPGSFTRDQISL